jgi:arylamine N-acetyltransferase
MSGELGDLYEAKRGLCYDRSRAIEKVLSHLGFEVRHAAVYSTKKTGRLAAFLTPKTQSHAVTEVKTEHGWLVIDSNRR